MTQTIRAANGRNAIKKQAKPPFKIADFMKKIRPSTCRPYMEMCWSYYNEALAAYMAGESYEVGRFHTKDGNPWVVC